MGVGAGGGGRGGVLNRVLNHESLSYLILIAAVFVWDNYCDRLCEVGDRNTAHGVFFWWEIYKNNNACSQRSMQTRNVRLHSVWHDTTIALITILRFSWEHCTGSSNQGIVKVESTSTTTSTDHAIKLHLITIASRSVRTVMNRIESVKVLTIFAIQTTRSTPGRPVHPFINGYKAEEHSDSHSDLRSFLFYCIEKSLP